MQILLPSCSNDIYTIIKGEKQLAHSMSLYPVPEVRAVCWWGLLDKSDEVHVVYHSLQVAQEKVCHVS